MFIHHDHEKQEVRLTEKNAEFTYGVHGPSLLQLVPDNQATILGQEQTEIIIHELDKFLMGSVRSLNEKFSLLRQAIMYGFIWRYDPEKGIQYFVYRRTKKNNEGQLAQKLSLGAGGHFESPDLVYYLNNDFVATDIISFWEMCNDNYYRERGEEVDGDDRQLYPYALPTLHGFVMDSKPEAGYVGNIHFGIITGVELISDDFNLNMKEPQNDAVGWFTAAELKAYVTGDTAKVLPEGESEGVKFEPWSVMMIDKIEELEATLKAA